MHPDHAANFAITVLQQAIAALVNRSGSTLSVRQIGVFLTAYLHDGIHTVNWLATEVGMSRVDAKRAVIKLDRIGLINRVTPDPSQKKHIIVERTAVGLLMMSFIRDNLALKNSENPDDINTENTVLA